ncbi:MAG TPA: (2Fe-2S)-binding protein, partial [Caulobacteraceae bacterium]|nr:(2Fe-2S)-binding protein [Caulobacteraceae bacterium]
MANDTDPSHGSSRRGFLTGGAGAAAALPLLAAARPTSLHPPAGAKPHMDMTLSINGRDHQVSLDPRTTLLDALHDHLGLTGSKKGCDHGQCGACTVHLDGRRVLACLTLAASVQGRPVTTIEGLSQGATLHPMQAAFIKHDAFQCGYCTPGQIMSAVACVKGGHAASPASIREFMSGNI